MKKLITPLYVFGLLSTSLAAEEKKAREVDFSQTIVAIDGKPQEECKEIVGADKKCGRFGTMTIGEVAAVALNTQDVNASIYDVIRAGGLAPKLIAGPKMALSAEDIVLIKAKLAKASLQPIWVYQLVAAIDPASVK